MRKSVHYAKTEELLAQVDEMFQTGTASLFPETVKSIVALAQIHATLAQGKDS